MQIDLLISDQSEGTKDRCTIVHTLNFFSVEQLVREVTSPRNCSDSRGMEPNPIYDEESSLLAQEGMFSLKMCPDYLLLDSS